MRTRTQEQQEETSPSYHQAKTLSAVFLLLKMTRAGFKLKACFFFFHAFQE
jgi:hypothetical protein